MTKKARRRQIMEAAGYTEKRIDYMNDDGDFVYKRSGDLLKDELREVLKALGAWSGAFDTQHKRAWRGHIRDAVGIEYDGMGWGRFDRHELTEIWRELEGDG